MDITTKRALNTCIYRTPENWGIVHGKAWYFYVGNQSGVWNTMVANAN